MQRPAVPLHRCGGHAHNPRRAVDVAGGGGHRCSRRRGNRIRNCIRNRICVRSSGSVDSSSVTSGTGTAGPCARSPPPRPAAAPPAATVGGAGACGCGGSAARGARREPTAAVTAGQGAPLVCGVGAPAASASPIVVGWS